VNIKVTEHQMCLLRRVVWNETVNFEQKAKHLKGSLNVTKDWEVKGAEYRELDQLLADTQRGATDKFHGLDWREEL